METSDFVVEEMKFQYTYGYLKNKVKIEIIFSTIAVIISMFLLRTKVLFYPFAFIGFDILGSIIFNIVSFSWSCFHWKRLSAETKLKEAKEHNENLYNWYPNSELMRDLRNNARYFLNDYISNLEHEIETIKEETIDTDNKEIAIYMNEINSFKKKLTVIRTEDNKEFLQELVSNMKQIVELVKERPSNSVFSNKIFNLYLPEIIALMESFPKDKEQQNKHKENLIEVINELNILVENTLKTIHNFNQRDADITFEVLMKEIKKAGEELDGGI